jgi:Glyoxalase-like domain
MSSLTTAPTPSDDFLGLPPAFLAPDGPALLELDHIVIATLDLEATASRLESEWGAKFSGGGQHLGFGTHNRVMKLDSVADLSCDGQPSPEKQVYIELIAPDPSQPNPKRPRLFDLDNPELLKKLAEKPRLIHFAARCKHMATALAQCNFNPGIPTPMSRGDLHWTITLPVDGKPASGVLPTLIEWPDMAKHPTVTMPASGISMVFFAVAAPEAAIRTLKATGLQFVPAVNPTIMLRAELVTPNGVKVLQ